jgi:DNA-binding transcriptional regulator YhcF (GntR family)
MSESSKRKPVTADNYFAIIPEWVLYAEIGLPAKLTYAVLHRHANSDGTCFPSRATLARLLNISVRSVDRAIDELQEIKAVKVQRRVKEDQGYTSNLYMVITNNPNAGTDSQQTETNTPLATKTTLPSVSNVPTPSDKNDTLNKAITKQSQETDISPAIKIAEEEKFQQFWAIYPKRKDIGKARAALKRALKKADLADILAGAENYARMRQGKDPQYTKLPASWLNAQAWMDEPDLEFVERKPLTARQETVDLIRQAKMRLDIKELGS